MTGGRREKEEGIEREVDDTKEEWIRKRGGSKEGRQSKKQKKVR